MLKIYFKVYYQEVRSDTVGEPGDLVAEAPDVLDGLPLVQHAVDLDPLSRQEQYL